MGRMKKAFVIAGTHSGVGKTTVSIGIMGALVKMGLDVQPFKAGPDYIDPGYHTALCRNPSYNLDTWMMGAKGVRATFARAMGSADIGVIEGVMGLFDGKFGSAGGEGSTSHIARVLGLPVLLVLDASGTSTSAAAIVKGFKGFERGVKIAGVLFNRVGSRRHFEMLKAAVEDKTNVPVFGYLPSDERLKLPHRHLGLITKGSLTTGEWGRFLRRTVGLVQENVDMKGLTKGLQGIRPGLLKGVRTGPRDAPGSGRRPRIAVARDAAMCFYYRENIELLEREGGAVVFFSPLKDKTLPVGTNGVYLGGGYPELYSARLERNSTMREAIRDFSLSGGPVFAECGGLMYLGRSLKDLEGRARAMAGVFPWTTRVYAKRRALGYREARIKAGCPFLERGETIRGHEYHYSDITTVPKGVKRVFSVSGSKEKFSEGYVYGNTLATYLHLHFASNPGIARGFLKRCVL